MRLPKTTKLKSGWRIQIQIAGHRYSCTGGNKERSSGKGQTNFRRSGNGETGSDDRGTCHGSVYRRSYNGGPIDVSLILYF